MLDHDATRKLADWFKDRWYDHWCVDITPELIAVLDESWARPDLLPPYWIYIKMAAHLHAMTEPGFAHILDTSP